MPLPVIDPAHYEDQLAAKLDHYCANFAEFDLPAPAVFRSAPLHYRLRAEFRLWHHDGRIDYAMFDSADPKQPILLDSFPAAAEPIARLMPRLRDAIQASEPLGRKVFQVDFLATMSGECLVSLIYHRPLDEAWEAAARTLAADLQIQLIGRSRKQKIVLGRDWVQEVLTVDGQPLRYQQFEGSFTQPNGGVNQHMLGWARAQAKGIGGAPGDLLELYCGNGNFTIALAPLFDRVLATEMSKPSVNAARTNLADNGVTNVTLVRMASEEISDALAGGREYQRMAGVELADYRFSTLFVDPPRAGLDAGTIALAKGFDNILYISCNPQSLRDNVAALADTHLITAAAAFDQFPYTHHLECGLLLQKR